MGQLLQLTCGHCGKTFERASYNVRGENNYCSIRCSAASRRAEPNTDCPECGTRFHVQPAKAKSAENNYCSTDCRDAAARKRVLLNCEVCGRSIERIPSHIKDGRQACSPECRYELIRKDRPKHRRMLNLPDHPVAAPSGLVSESRAVLYDKIGAGPHGCYWCGEVVEWLPGEGPVAGALVADHLNFDGHDNRPENLVPSCQPCNTSRDRLPNAVGDDEDYVVRANGTRTRAVRRTCHTCGEEFLIPPSLLNHRENAGKYCSRECLWNRPR